MSNEFDAIAEAASELTDGSRRVVESMVFRCLIATSLLTVIAVVAFLISRDAALGFQYDATVIDQMGRQRARLNRLGLLIEKLAAEPSTSERQRFRDEIELLSVDLVATHRDAFDSSMLDHDRGFLQRLPTELQSDQQQLQAGMLELFGLLLQLSSQPLGEIDKSSEPTTRILAITAEQELVIAHDTLIRAFTVDVKQSYTQLLAVQYATLGLALATILGTALFVFAPMVRDVRRETSRLVDANELYLDQQLGLSRALNELKTERADRRGRVRAMASILEDLENEKASLNREVQTRKQVQEALEVSQLELQQKNAEMQQFVYTVSHDLKSPLVTCEGFVGVMREDAAAQRWDDVVDSLDRVQRATGRMNELIEDLLELSRIGTIRNEPEWVDVATLLDDLREEFGSRIDNAGAQLVIQENLPGVNVDRIRLTEVFENLISNAIKYGCSGTDPVITVGAASEDHETRYFVRDNGPGIAPEHHEKIFRLFQRLQNSGKGTGVGLAAVAKIVDVNGGRYWVESDVGQGATFWIAFPASLDSSRLNEPSEHETS
ncbi:MAG: hypothetical protein HKN47_08850 [Pirellulaceae bacterium]|nr:hypothetical protein [Pirellulaceae bacterium]